MLSSVWFFLGSKGVICCMFGLSLPIHPRLWVLQGRIVSYSTCSFCECTKANHGKLARASVTFIECVILFLELLLLTFIFYKAPCVGFSNLVETLDVLISTQSGIQRRWVGFLGLEQKLSAPICIVISEPNQIMPRQPLCIKNLRCVRNSFILVGCHNLQIRVLDSLQRALEKMWAEEKQRFLLFWSLHLVRAAPPQAWAIIPVFRPGELHGLYSPWGGKELDMTERLSLHFPRSHIISLSSSFISFLYLPWLWMSVAPKCQSFVVNRSLLPQNFLMMSGNVGNQVWLILIFRACSVMSDSVTPWTVAHQAPLSMEFFRQEYWNELPFPPPEPASLLIFSTVIYLSYDGNPGLVWFSIVLKAPKESGWQFQVQHFLVTVPFWLSHLFDGPVHSVGIFLWQYVSQGTLVLLGSLSTNSE